MNKVITKEIILTSYLEASVSEVSFQEILIAMQKYADQENSSLQSRIKVLEEALKELVDLKNIKDTLLKKEYFPTDENYQNHIDYLHRKPIAWENAKKLIYR